MLVLDVIVVLPLPIGNQFKIPRYKTTLFREKGDGKLFREKGEGGEKH